MTADNERPIFREVAEADATGRTREIYDDFKSVIGLPMVNLIYRHMATTPGCLEWAWALLRPHFTSGGIETEARRLVGGIALQAAPPLSPRTLREARVDEAAAAAIARTLDAYNRANPMNLIAMAVLAGELRGAGHAAPITPPDAEPIARVSASALPPMADLEGLPDGTRAVIDVLAAQAGVGGTAVVPTLYRHLTGWPGYLALAAEQVGRLADDGILDRAESALRDGASRAARSLPRYAVDLPAPSAGQRDNLLGLIDLFPAAIARMIVIGVHLRRSMPA